jgi:hydrogenase nickel incorporation protein HypB
VLVREGILAKNDRIAERNRGYFAAKGVFVLNLLSSPGSGKTTLIERMAADLKGRLRLGVVVGDLATDNDARRLEAAGVPAVQITTGTVCHLDAGMVAGAMTRLPLDHLDLLIIENVGNLVCPAAFDLGEGLRVVLISVTEGEDKPLKYPTIFRDAAAVLLTKTDLTEAAGFDRETALRNIGRAAPTARVLEVSARTGRGMQAWYAALEAARAARAASQR